MQNICVIIENKKANKEIPLTVIQHSHGWNIIDWFI